MNCPYCGGKPVLEAGKGVKVCPCGCTVGKPA
jgi:hypothetical protein